MRISPDIRDNHDHEWLQWDETLDILEKEKLVKIVILFICKGANCKFILQKRGLFNITDFDDLELRNDLY